MGRIWEYRSGPNEEACFPSLHLFALFLSFLFHLELSAFPCSTAASLKHSTADDAEGFQIKLLTKDETCIYAMHVKHMRS